MLMYHSGSCPQLDFFHVRDSRGRTVLNKLVSPQRWIRTYKKEIRIFTDFFI